MTRRTKAAKTGKRKKPAAPLAKPAEVPPEAVAVQQAEAEKPVAQATAIPELIEQLQRGELASRAEAAIRLGKLGDPQATAVLVEALRDPTAEVAREAAWALGRIPAVDTLQALVDVVLNRDDYFHNIVRTVAVESLANFYHPLAVCTLIASVRDPSFETSLAAIHALGALGDAQAVPALQDAASNADGFFLPAAQLAAVEVLKTFPG